jgi:hypothetical protein
MHNKCDFFQEQIKKCNGLAERASDKTDREFWLGMARRWEGMLEAGERGRSKSKSGLDSSALYLKSAVAELLPKLA